jgi:hypothetical protein
MAPEKKQELERVTRLRGFRYGLHDFLAEVDLDAPKGINDKVEAEYINASLLDRKTKELLILPACITKRMRSRTRRSICMRPSKPGLSKKSSGPPSS